MLSIKKSSIETGLLIWGEYKIRTKSLIEFICHYVGIFILMSESQFGLDRRLVQRQQQTPWTKHDMNDQLLSQNEKSEHWSLVKNSSVTGTQGLLHLYFSNEWSVSKVNVIPKEHGVPPHNVQLMLPLHLMGMLYLHTFHPLQVMVSLMVTKFFVQKPGSWKAFKL